MNLKSISFVQKMFRDYYMRDYTLGNSLLMIDKREFGFFLFEGWMLRHKSFKHSDELKEFLQSSVPSDAYCSCAYYEDPEADMDRKGWLGADLVFDIDADHIPTPCDKVHDKWVCGVCGLAGKGFTPSKCPVCGGEKFEVSTWPCEVCLNSAKIEAEKLLDMLMQDFGFSKKDIRVFFSGHRGYHVHVESEAVRTLDAIARKEIVDYVSGLGLDVFFHGLSKKSLRETPSSQVSPLGEFGWRKRLALGMQNFILNAKGENLKEIGIKKKIAETILQNRDVILKNWLNRGAWGAVRGIGFETWRKIAKHSSKLQSAKIDTVVTTDIHRLIRLAGTLHGKTGLKKVEFPVSAIDDFDPFKDAVAFKSGTVTVFVSDAPEFRVGDEVFGPYRKQRVELPTAAAMLLVCKGRAEVIE
jgi:DNA primase small subunit